MTILAFILQSLRNATSYNHYELAALFLPRRQVLSLTATYSSLRWLKGHNGHIEIEPC
jgi:hypothetical protein